MSEISQKSPTINVPLPVSAYDRVNSALVVSIILGSALLALLTLAWIFQTAPVTTVIDPEPTTIFPAEPTPPDPNQVNLFDQSTADLQPLEQAVEKVGSVVAKLSLTKGLGGTGLGDGFGGTGIDPRERVNSTRGYTWSVSQTAADLNDYRRKLDFFDIQIGVVHKTRNTIWRISDLSTKKTITQSNRSAESASHRFANRNNRLRRWDVKIAAEAGVQTDETLVVHFYPPELIERLRQLLTDHAGHRMDDVQHVEFRVAENNANDGFRFEIASVEYKSAAK